MFLLLWTSVQISTSNPGNGANGIEYIHSLCQSMWLWTDIFSGFSELLCTLREISKRWCNNDMDQLSFCMFSQKQWPQMTQKQTRVLTTGFFEHTALCKFEKRLSRTCAFHLCESRLPRIFFPYYYSRNNTLLHSTCFSPISDIPRCVLSP